MPTLFPVATLIGRMTYVHLKDTKLQDAHKAAIEVIVTIPMCELILGLSTFHVFPTPLIFQCLTTAC